MSVHPKWCSRLSDDLSLINLVIDHVIESSQSPMIVEYESMLEFLSQNISIRKIPKIKQLIARLIDDVTSQEHSEQQMLSKLVTMHNIVS